MNIVTLCSVIFLIVSCEAFCPASESGDLPAGISEEDFIDPDDTISYDEESPELPEGLQEAYEMHGENAGGEPVEDDDVLKMSKSMQEIVDATMKNGFSKLFKKRTDKRATAMELLQYTSHNTNIEPSYLSGVFISATKVDSQKDLEEKMYVEEKALKILSKVLQHFQSNPLAGRPKEELEEANNGDTESKEDRKLEDIQQERSSKEDESKEEL
ncbi:uncharacterized protein LOC120342319 [Styela clava]|uniref:uncharacterized protein LOC120342319 n=1 Tax=Styela clava TaxID=7725 RepID=UPI00193AAAB1|nr:uncharacterized protein LOC120342319 [Styela clava]